MFKLGSKAPLRGREKLNCGMLFWRDVAGNHIYVGDFGNHRVQIFEKGTGNYVGQFGCKGRSI